MIIKKKRQKTDLTIIVVTYNSEKFIDKCFFSIEKNSGNFSKKIIVFDNNSKDKTINIINKFKKNKKNFRIIQNKNNIGFGKALNKCFKFCNSKYILFLNPDAFVINKGIAKIVNFMEKNKNLDIVGGKTYKINKKNVNITFRRKPSVGTILFEFTNLKKIFPKNKFSDQFLYSKKIPKRPKIVDAVSASFMCIKRDIIGDKLNFDENFFLYLEDLDFCLRAKSMGFKIMYYPSAAIVHLGGGSSCYNKFHINEKEWRKSRKYFLKKYFNSSVYFAIKFLFYIEDIVLDLREKFLKNYYA